MSEEEYYRRVRPYFDLESKNNPVKEYAREIISKLKEEGHEKYIVTARGRSFTDATKSTREYLEKNNIPYDNSANKGLVCQNNNIDILIDDSVKHSLETMKYGIDALTMATNYNQDYPEY